MTLPEPSVCPRCHGEGTIPMPKASHALGVVVEVTCTDCCCPCGEHTGGGFCAECEQADWLDCELSYGRGQDR